MLKIYKPNPRVTGAIGTFNFGQAKKGVDDGEIVPYVSILLQASWDESTKRGSFKENAKNPEKNINVKLSEFEAGNIINSIKRRVEWKGFHSSDANKTQISFTPLLKDNVFTGFSFSCFKNGASRYAFTLTPGEAENLLIYLDVGLRILYGTRIKAFLAGRPTASRPVSRSAPQVEEQIEEQPEQTELSPEEIGGEEENPFGS